VTVCSLQNGSLELAYLILIGQSLHSAVKKKNGNQFLHSCASLNILYLVFHIIKSFQLKSIFHVGQYFIFESVFFIWFVGIMYSQLVIITK